MKHCTLIITGLLAFCLAVSVAVAGEGLVKLTHDWPGYAGPNGTFSLPDPTPILAELKQSKLVWVNEQADLGFARSTWGGGHCYPKTMEASGSSIPIVAGAPFAFRNVPGYKSVCGYEVHMIHPFVDGYLFTRVMDVKKGMGVIMCWDLRQPVLAQR